MDRGADPVLPAGLDVLMAGLSERNGFGGDKLAVGLLMVVTNSLNGGLSYSH